MDRVLLSLFPKTFLRFADHRLNRAFSRGEINSYTLHILDNRFKFGLAPGYTDPDKAGRVTPPKRPVIRTSVGGDWIS
jgi:hypothetical protein